MLYQAATGRSTAEWNADETLTVVVEMSLSSWLIAGLLPGVERRPLKKLAPDEGALMALIERWRQEAAKAGRTITRVVVAYEFRARRLGTGLEPACPCGGRFIDQLDGTLAIWDADHASSPSPQIASAFFLRTSKAAASARAFSFRCRSRSITLMR